MTDYVDQLMQQKILQIVDTALIDESAEYPEAFVLRGIIEGYTVLSHIMQISQSTGDQLLEELAAVMASAARATLSLCDFYDQRHDITNEA